MLAATYDASYPVSALRKLFSYDPQPQTTPLFTLGN